MGIFPVKFYDKNDQEILSTMMIVPAMLNFNLYNDIQEDPENYIITYDPGSEICSLGIQKNVANVEFFINQIYLYSKSPQIPYNLMTELMFRCLEINSIDLTGPARFRDAVQQAGVLQAVLFQDISSGLIKGLSATLNGREPVPTPLEMIIKS